MRPTVTREQVRSMLREMVPELALRFEDERADEASLLVELPSEELIADDPESASLRALDRLDRAAVRRDISGH